MLGEKEMVKILNYLQVVGTLCLLTLGTRGSRCWQNTELLLTLLHFLRFSTTDLVLKWLISVKANLAEKRSSIQKQILSPSWSRNLWMKLRYQAEHKGGGGIIAQLHKGSDLILCPASLASRHPSVSKNFCHCKILFIHFFSPSPPILHFLKEDLPALISMQTDFLDWT